ncbi:MAG: head GIN domain-containing protein [Flavobacteriaceae bacterium]|nr:DUF2807 domain-containing protein [Flavobacteriaceae bacterium]
MKKIIAIVTIGLLFSCNSENANDCFQTDGKIITTAFNVPNFQKIRIEDDVSLIIKQGITQEVLIETGANLLNDISVAVEGETLVIRNHNGCNLVRDFGITKAIVTVQNITEIRNSSIYHVVGEGELNVPFLRLVSNTTGGLTDSKKSGDFTLTIRCEDFRIEANGYSGFYIDGFSEKATIAFEDEVPRLEGANLIVNDLYVFQRSANKMIVHPVNRIRGVIRGTGNVISVQRPPIVAVEEFYTGRLIFED